MSVSELTLGLRATPFKISSSSLSSGSAIKVQSAFANNFLGNDHNTEAPQNLDRTYQTYIKTLKHISSSFQLKNNVLFSSTSSISVPTDSFEFQCIPITAITYKGLKSKWVGTVKDGVWEKEGEEGRTMFIKHRVGSRSHLSL